MQVALCVCCIAVCKLAILCVCYWVSQCCLPSHLSSHLSYLLVTCFKCSWTWIYRLISWVLTSKWKFDVRVHCYVHNEHSAQQLIYRGLYFGAPCGSKILLTGVHLHLGKVPADKGSVLAYAVIWRAVKAVKQKRTECMYLNMDES